MQLDLRDRPHRPAAAARAADLTRRPGNGRSSPAVVAPDAAPHGFAGFDLAQGVRLLTALVWFGYADWWVQQSAVSYAPLMAIGQGAAAIVVMALAVLVKSPEGRHRLDRF